MFGTERFVSDMAMKNSFVNLRANEKGGEGFWIVNAFSLFRVQVRNHKLMSEEELSFCTIFGVYKTDVQKR